MASALIDRLVHQARRDRPAIGDVWVFPSPEDPTQPCSRHLVRDWGQRGEALAGLAHEGGAGWHSLRRKVATGMKNGPLVGPWLFGGGKEPQSRVKGYHG